MIKYPKFGPQHFPSGKFEMTVTCKEYYFHTYVINNCIISVIVYNFINVPRLISDFRLNYLKDTAVLVKVNLISVWTEARLRKSTYFIF